MIKQKQIPALEIQFNTLYLRYNEYFYERKNVQNSNIFLTKSLGRFSNTDHLVIQSELSYHHTAQKITPYESVDTLEYTALTQSPTANEVVLNMQPMHCTNNKFRVLFYSAQHQMALALPLSAGLDLKYLFFHKINNNQITNYHKQEALDLDLTAKDCAKIVIDASKLFDDYYIMDSLVTAHDIFKDYETMFQQIQNHEYAETTKELEKQLAKIKTLSPTVFASEYKDSINNHFINDPQKLDAYLEEYNQTAQTPITHITANKFESADWQNLFIFAIQAEIDATHEFANSLKNADNSQLSETFTQNDVNSSQLLQALTSYQQTYNIIAPNQPPKLKLIKDILQEETQEPVKEKQFN